MAMREPDSRTDALAHAVIGAAIEVHRHLGAGFTEDIYEEALCLELRARSIPFERQKRIPIEYKGTRIGVARLDMLVGERLVVELKALSAIPAFQVAKVLSYLRASDCDLALLINFNAPLLRQGVQRLVRTTGAP